jgi:cystathionine beta-lyase
MLGQQASPDDCALALRGLRTMQVRLDRSCASALQVAEWLQGRPEIAAVLFPMLPGAPGHELWKRDFSGGCGLMTIIMAGKDTKARDAMVDALSLFGIGYSWGGFESLALGSHPERDRDVLPWPPRGIAPENRHAVRLWIGLEDPVDLIKDLECGLAAWAAA